MKQLLYLALALGMVACGDKSEVPANQLAGNDFESMDGWLGDTGMGSLTKDKAHSGRYAIKVDAKNEYSIGYGNMLGKLSASKLKKVKIRAWVNLPDANSKAVLVTQIANPTDPSKPLMWDGFKLTDKVKTYNKWVEVEREIALPENVTYADKLGVYLWRASTSAVTYLDDLSIEKVD